MLVCAPSGSVQLIPFRSCTSVSQVLANGMHSNIWTLVSGRNESSPRRYLPIMYWMTIIAVMIILVSACFADENASYNEAKMIEQVDDNIRWLRQAKEQVEREEREKNSLATLTDLMIKDSFDSQLMSKVDILYDNQTDLNKELKFVPQVFNCGKEFDIFKVLELAKAHKNITTEQPPCLMDEDDNMCPTKKPSGGSDENKGMKTTAPPLSKEAPGGVRAFAIQAAISTRMPPGQPAVEKRTEPAVLRQSTPNPLTKTAKLKPENKEKPLPVGKQVGGKITPNHLQKQFEPKGIINNPAIAYRKFGAEPVLDDVQIEDNPFISEDQPQRWYASQEEQYEPLQYSSIENQNKNDAQIKLQEPQVRPEATPESSQQQLKSAQLPIVETVPQPSPSQAVEQPQVQNVEKGEIVLEKQPGLEQTQGEVCEQGYQAGQRDQKVRLSIMYDKKKQNLEKKGSGVTQVQQQPQQLIILTKQAPVQYLTQPQFSEQQKHFNQQQLPISDKQTQQQPQPLEKQNQQQTIEQHNQQPFQTSEKKNQELFQTLEKQNQQQFQTLDKQNQHQYQTLEKQQLQTAEQQKQQQLQTAEQQKQQQLQTPEQQKQQQLQITELQKQQQLQTAEQQRQQQFQTVEQQQLQSAEQQKQQQFQTAEQQKQQPFQTMEKHSPQLQIIEKQFSAIMPAVTDSEHQKHIFGSEQQQAAQKTSNYANEQQQILKLQTLFPQRIEQNQQLQTLFPQRIEQNQQTPKPIVNSNTSAQQAAQMPEPQSVAKLPSENPCKGLPESIGEKIFNNNTDKTMMSAPINVMVMEPNADSSYGTPASKFNLITGNIPATAYFWGYTMAQTAKIHNYDSLKTEQNNAVSVASQLESSDIPGNIQENPQEDYLYYQDQD